MLLGIGLHACLSFFPWFWPVVDRTASFSGPFDEFLWLVHGFRMQVFFLLSGFFTAMLWRRRGLVKLLWHRFRRIVLPLAIGFVTIIPLVDWVSARAGADSADARTSALVEEGDIWGAVSSDDAAAAEAILAGGAKLDGANADGSTPFLIAYLFANSGVADLLAGAGLDDPRAPGQHWSDLRDWGSLSAAPEWSFRPVLEASEPEDGIDLESWIQGFHHLWFLWFLCWFAAGFAAVVGAASLFRRVRSAVGRRLRGRSQHPTEGLAAPATPAALEGAGRPRAGAWSRRLVWVLVPLSLLPQLDMGGGGEFPVFGPDTSDELLPPAHVLLYYAAFFAFGALIHGRRSASGKPMIEAVGRNWTLVLPVTAIAVAWIGLWITFEGGPWLLASVFQLAYAWGMVFGLIGLFQQILAQQKPWVRYLSDSSYWLYVAHLPLVIAAQSWVSDWSLPAVVKFLGICLGCTALLLASYQVFVRHTPIGWLLNGRRARRQPAAG